MTYITKPKLWADLETRNVLDINNALYNATAEVIMFIYAFGDGPVKVWCRRTGAQRAGKYCASGADRRRRGCDLLRLPRWPCAPVRGAGAARGRSER